MARRRSRRRNKRRSRSRFTPGKLLVGAVIVLGLGYFTFTRVFFDPFETSQRDFTFLVPWNVDLFVQRKDFASDFTSFPRPREVQRLLNSAAWREFSGGSWWQSLEWPDELELSVIDLEAALKEVHFDVLQDVLGSEVVLVGRSVATAGQFALLSRLSAAGKLAIEALDFEGAFTRAFPGAERVARTDPDVPDVHYDQIDLATGEVLFLARETDLLVVGNDEPLVRDVLRTLHGSSELSVGLSRLYLDHMPPLRGADADRFSAGFTLDAEQLIAAWELEPELEDRKPDAMANILPRVIDPELLRDAVGRLEIDQGVLHLRAHAELDVARASADEGGLLGQPPSAISERLGRSLNAVPSDVSAVLALNVSVRKFLRTVVDGFDPEVRKLIDTTLRDVARNNPTWPVSDVLALINELDSALEGQITVALRPPDHESAPGTQPLPTMAFMAPVRSLEKWNAIEMALLNAWHVLDLKRENMFQLPEGGVGMQKWVVVQGLPFEEVAWIVLDNEHFVLATDHDFLSEIVRVYTGAHRSIGQQRGPRALLEAFSQPAPFEARANLMAWFSAGGVSQIVDRYSSWIADNTTAIDFAVERARERKQLIARDYATWRGREEQLPPDVGAEIDAKLDAAMDALEAKRLQDQVPAFADEWLANWSWLGLLQEAAFSLRLGDRSLDLDLHVATITAP